MNKRQRRCLTDTTGSNGKRIPPVVTDMGDNTRHVTHSIEGFLAQRSDNQAIRERLLELLSSPIKREIMGSLARNRVERDFDHKGVIERYSEHIYTMIPSVRS